MATVTQFLGEFRLRFPDVTDTMGLLYVNRAVRMLAFRVPLRRAEEMIPAVQNQAKYDVPASVERIEQVYWETSSDSPATWKLLTETSEDELNLLNRAWRTTASASAPTHWYRTTGAVGATAETAIGIYPPPNATASGSPAVPRIHIYGAGTIDLALGDSLPTNLLTNDVLLDVMSFLFAKDRKRDEVAYWKPLADIALGEGVQHVKEGSSQGKTEFVPQWAPASRGR